MNVSSATQDDRRHTEDKLAIIMIWIVIVFIVCHFPGIILTFHDTLEITNIVACWKKGYFASPPWMYELLVINDVLLVLNSSVNSVIYFMLSLIHI